VNCEGGDDDGECHGQEMDSCPDAGLVIHGGIHPSPLGGWCSMLSLAAHGAENGELTGVESGAVSRSSPSTSDQPVVTGSFIFSPMVQRSLLHASRSCTAPSSS